jgi:hypothetical protein
MNADDDLILARIGSILDDIEHRDSLPFNGLMGAMPEWVPQPFKDEFRRTRNSLLNNHSENQIIKWINEYKMMVNAPYGVSTPNISYEISLQNQIERLFILSHAVQLGEIEGLRFLAGDEAVIGAKSKNGYKARADQLDKSDFQVLAKPLLKKNKNIIDKTLREKELAPYVRKWSQNALRGWLRELRPTGHKQTGRPNNI